MRLLNDSLYGDKPLKVKGYKKATSGKVAFGIDKGKFQTVRVRPWERSGYKDASKTITLLNPLLGIFLPGAINYGNEK